MARARRSGPTIASRARTRSTRSSRSTRARSAGRLGPTRPPTPGCSAPSGSCSRAFPNPVFAATALSGGEAQRVKLATELSRRATGRTLYVLDEPTTGLHFADVEKLMQVLHRLVDAGNTVIVIEHNLDVIKTADQIVDLGPEGGLRGGRVIAKGTPEKVAATSGSATGEYLQRVLRGESVVPLTDVTFADEAGRGDRAARAARTNGRDK